MTYTFRDWYIPDRMMEELEAFIHLGRPPGDFLYAVLTNDFTEACGRADDENLENLPAYAAFLYNEAPSKCHGSPEKVNEWITAIARADRP